MRGLAHEQRRVRRGSVEDVEPAPFLSRIAAVLIIVVIIAVSNLARRRVVLPRCDLVELTRRASDELFELTAIKPYPPAGMAHVDNHSIPLALFEGGSLAAWAVHDALLNAPDASSPLKRPRFFIVSLLLRAPRWRDTYSLSPDSHVDHNESSTYYVGMNDIMAARMDWVNDRTAHPRCRRAETGPIVLWLGER